MRPTGNRVRRGRGGGEHAAVAVPDNISDDDLAFLVTLWESLQAKGLTGGPQHARVLYDFVDEQYRASVQKTAYPIAQYQQALILLLADFFSIAHGDVQSIVTSGLQGNAYMMFRPVPTVTWRVYVDTTVERHPRPCCGTY